jgi:hypothetical protein
MNGMGMLQDVGFPLRIMEMVPKFIHMTCLIAVLTSGLRELKHFFQFTLLKERIETYVVFYISATFFAKSL